MLVDGRVTGLGKTEESSVEEGENYAIFLILDEGVKNIISACVHVFLKVQTGWVIMVDDYCGYFVTSLRLQD